MNGDFAVYNWQIIELPTTDEAEQAISLIGAVAALTISVIACAIAAIRAVLLHPISLIAVPIFAILAGLLLGTILSQTTTCQPYFAITECQP
ncbi:hypothetical protein [Leucobacter sp. USHLN154]|uniref:hypothetical protein n=1 Tax=Leucobacter sp. USHLN154 TaxID=3081269 RepID=UPI0030183787